MSGRLEGHVTLVTGGGSGIGAAIVERFTTEGARVVVLERSAERAASIAEQHGDAVVIAIGDVRSAADNDGAVAAALDAFGRLDSVVANAGIYDYGRTLARLSADELVTGFEEMFSINVLGPMLAARAASNVLAEHSGAIVVTVSCAGLYAGGGGPLYVASKHAAVGLVRQLALELAPDVRVNGVAPGFTRTDLRGPESLGISDRSLAGATGFEAVAAEGLPLRKIADPADHASLYVTLASRHESPHTTGVVIPSDGGLEVRWPGGAR